MFYYEIHHSMLSKYNGAKYVCSRDRLLMAMLDSIRCWLETGHAVGYIKNRESEETPVDLTEFMWIKLSAKEIA